ncbi:cysteine-rich receptor-like protein kinase 3 [Tasmannia lanceolata]|uniref:cysteine-rich receptor-like protein kinase 3 n=1 Tax=Tasmannia lanceolata TaxID=3420 RepID=UPI0040648F7E
MDFASSYLIFLLLVFFSISPCFSDPRSSVAALICSNVTSTASVRQSFINSYLSAMDGITPIVHSKRFAEVIRGTGNATLFSLGQCMDDLSTTDCDLCFAQCKIQIVRCLPFQRATRGGRVFLDGCYLRYDDYNFFDEALSPVARTVCGVTQFGGNQTDFAANRNQTDFAANTNEIMRNLSIEAPKNNGFFAGFVGGGNSTAYGLAQCWDSLNTTSCSMCLENAVSNIGSCLPNEEGRVLNSGCYMRYSTQKFYNDSGSGNASAGGNGHQTLAIILATTSSVLTAAMIIISCVFFWRRKLKRMRKERAQLGALAATVNKSELNFKYETLERATNYFHSSNKLGHGASGTVYKGILPDGKVIAIKRLLFNTRQWVDDFFNEVNLISRVHHKNLVKLLGCSITGPESLLVYEYVPNKSLHQHLFDETNARLLTWDMRYHILVGTAEGLAYLHEESELRIIHRDIKLGNILLDENFMAKIADFGLARLFPEDKTHISTAIAGTRGYMAPEYLVRGKLTEKADVYSFGVLLIEVICGKRINSYPQEPSSILHLVWNLYTSRRLSEAVDPTMEGRFREEDAFRVLHIGLLCTQASPELRPTMSMVVKMLTDESSNLPSPAQPPFLNSNTEIPSVPFEIFRPESNSQSSGNSMTVTLLDPR